MEPDFQVYVQPKLSKEILESQELEEIVGRTGLIIGYVRIESHPCRLGMETTMWLI